MPGVLKGSIPTEDDKGKITEEDCLSTLTGREKCLEQAGAAFVLSEFSEDEVFLLPKDDKQKQCSLFTETDAKLAFDQFQDRLEEIEKAIKSRNENAFQDTFLRLRFRINSHFKYFLIKIFFYFLYLTNEKS